MKIAVMQPYLLPYLGYWQLMNEVDIFVVYNNIEYTKRGWINRNKLESGYITLPLAKSADNSLVCERNLSSEWPKHRDKLIRRFREYKGFENFTSFYPVIEQILMCRHTNLFDFIFNSIFLIKTYLQVDTKLVISSHLDIDHSLRKHHKVNAICQALGATTYVNPIGGISLYDQSMIDCELQFLQMNYFQHEKIPDIYLSIADLLMRVSEFQPLLKEWEYASPRSI